MSDRSTNPITVDHQAPVSGKKAVRKPRSLPLAIKLSRIGFKLGGRLAPAVAGRIAHKLWFTPTRFRTPDSETAVLESSSIDYLQVNKRTIATYSWGKSGPTILLVHGWSGRGTQLGGFVKPLLASGYRVLSFDAPAHGKSTGKQTNLYEVADTLLAIQERHGPFYSIITHSFGGPCTALALQRGLKTERIVCIAPPATTLGLVEKFCSALCIPTKSRNFLIKHIENQFGDNVWDDLSMVNTTRGLEVPGLLIHDANDNEIPCHESHAIVAAWNSARLQTTSGLGHRRILRDADVIKSTVGFINNLRQS